MSNDSKSSVEVIRTTDDDIGWVEYPMENDATPEGHGHGEFAVLHRSDDGNFQIGVWRRSCDIGALNGNATPEDTNLKKYDIVLDGSVEVTDSKGVKHTVTAGDVLAYDGSETGEWNQPGSILKISVMYRA
jgi:uncharacterized cupin superfamily protein